MPHDPENTQQPHISALLHWGIKPQTCEHWGEVEGTFKVEQHGIIGMRHTAGRSKNDRISGEKFTVSPKAKCKLS